MPHRGRYLDLTPNGGIIFRVGEFYTTTDHG